MSDIPNTEYLTINQKGIFIGGQPAVYYCGEKLHSQSLIKTYFDYIQEKFPTIQEIHVLSSETAGARYDINAQPSQHHGNYAWCRIKFNNGMLSKYWVLDDKYNSVPQSYGYCVVGISYDINFRTKLFLMQNEHRR